MQQVLGYTQFKLAKKKYGRGRGSLDKQAINGKFRKKPPRERSA